MVNKADKFNRKVTIFADPFGNKIILDIGCKFKIIVPIFALLLPSIHKIGLDTLVV